MTVTSPLIMFGLYALELKQDAVPSTTTVLQSFSKINDLKTNNASGRPFATYEPDYWLLDGNYKFLPTDYTNVHVGMVSNAMSDYAGMFATPPVLTITFSVPQAIDGVSLTFGRISNDYINNLIVDCYDGSSALISSKMYSPTGVAFSTDEEVIGVKTIVITFNSTNKPYRYLRVTGIDFGNLLTLDASSIKEAQAIEQVSVLSTELPFGTLDLTLISDDDDFDITNPAGFYHSLYQRQPLACYEYVDGQFTYIGQYYLETWENQSETLIQFRCIDTLGVVDTITYMGGIWPAGINLRTLLDSILTPVGIPFELDSRLDAVTVKGWIPIGSIREALQHIGFAVGATVSAARYGGIQIYKAPDLLVDAASVSYGIYDLSIETALKLKAMVTGVEIIAHHYTASTNTQELLNKVKAIGTYKVEFSEPMHSLTITGATITSSGANYAIVNVTVAGTVVLTGKQYNDSISTYAKNTVGLPSTIKPNVIRIDQAYLVNPDNAGSVRDRVYQYYQHRYLQTTKVVAPLVRTGSIATMSTVKGKDIKAIIERMDMNLSGGFVTALEATGVING